MTVTCVRNLCFEVLEGAGSGGRRNRAVAEADDGSNHGGCVCDVYLN